MATYKATTLITNATILLQDPTNVRWPIAELVGWLNDGQREIVAFKPNACVKNIGVVLVAGTKQSLPADGINLIDVVRNVSSGTAIRIVSREILDAQVPGWHAATAAADAKHFCYSPLDPKYFYVYPPQPNSPGTVEMVYTAVPIDIALVSGQINPNTQVIGIDDIYASPLLNYVMFRAYGKDAEYARNAELQKVYADLFQMQLTGKVASEVATNPNSSLAPGNPNLVKDGK